MNKCALRLYTESSVIELESSVIVLESFEFNKSAL